jgi:hypothetical protein
VRQKDGGAQQSKKRCYLKHLTLPCAVTFLSRTFVAGRRFHNDFVLTTKWFHPGSHVRAEAGREAEAARLETFLGIARNHPETDRFHPAVRSIRRTDHVVGIIDWRLSPQRPVGRYR